MTKQYESEVLASVSPTRRLGGKAHRLALVDREVPKPPTPGALFAALPSREQTKRPPPP